MKTTNDILKAIAISLMALNILLVFLGYIFVQQTNAMISAERSLVNVEYSRCVSDMDKVGDKCSK